MNNSEYFEAVAKLLGVELGEEFKVSGVGGNRHRLTRNGLESFLTNWGRSPRDFNQLTPENIVKIPFEPKLDESYFFPSPLHKEGFGCTVYNGDTYDAQFKRNLGFFRTEAEAIAEAKKRGWID